MAISAISIAALVNKHNTLSTIIALEGGHYWHVWNIAVPIIKPSLKAGAGKTLCEILTVADAMPLSMADPRVDHSLSQHGSVWPHLQLEGNRIWSRLPRFGSRAASMWADSDPNAVPPAICLRFTVVRQLPNLTPQRPN